MSSKSVNSNVACHVTLLRDLLSGIIALIFLCGPGFIHDAEAQTRKLKLYYLHTGEKATIAYKRNGKFLPAGLKKINVFLRDWRRNEPTRMDPLLMDLVWEIYQKSGSKDYIHVISGYRSPATNNMLRKRGRGVAKKSQHTLGKALDFFLPDVKLAKLRKIGLIKQVGGVGYYPRSGSPFVHMDTGRVRHWPRMNRKELVQVFPNGKTLHVPTDGKPLPGYNQAVASFNARKSSSKKIELAKGNEKERKSFFQRLASLRNNNNDDEETGTFANLAPRRVSTKPKTEPANTGLKPLAPLNTPDKPSLPLAPPVIAIIPVPLSAPRNAPDVPKNTEQANLSAQVKPEAIQAEAIPLDDETAAPADVFNIPVPKHRPDFISNTPIQVAAAERPVENTLQDNSLSENALRTTTVSEGLRDKLIAQARIRLRTQLLAAPRPPVAIEPSFKTALLPTDEKIGNANDKRLTRSLTPDTAKRAIDNVFKSDGTIPLPQPSPNPIVVEPNQPSSVIETASLSPEPLDEVLTNNGEIPLPKQNPQVVAVAALEPAQSNEISPVSIVPSKRPQLIASSSPVALSAKNSLALGDDNAKIQATRDNLAALMAKQSQQLTASQALEKNEISPMILAAIPTQSPLRQNKVVAALPQKTVRIKPAVISQTEQSPDWFNQKGNGTFVLAGAMTINEAAKMRAPAYGRAIIRHTPNSVLLAGFTPTRSIQESSKFRGKALEFLPFQKFN